MPHTKSRKRPFRMPIIDYLTMGYQSTRQSFKPDRYIPYKPEPYRPAYPVETYSPATDGHMHKYFNQMREKTPKEIESDRLVVYRKNQADMTPNEQAAFRAAFESIIASGFLSTMVEHHQGSFAMHGNPRFLPWHRVYLDLLENELLLTSPGTFLPYWSWSEDRAVPDWIASWLPQVGSINVFRNTGDISGSLPTSGQVTTTVALTDHAEFAFQLEQLHNTVHVVVGGTMGAIATAPADPIFWMHHAEIDRIWNKWQQDNQGENPALFGTDAVMTPWTINEQDTRNIEQDFGYLYS